MLFILLKFCCFFFLKQVYVQYLPQLEKLYSHQSRQKAIFKLKYAIFIGIVLVFLYLIRGLLQVEMGCTRVKRVMFQINIVYIFNRFNFGVQFSRFKYDPSVIFRVHLASLCFCNIFFDEFKSHSEQKFEVMIIHIKCQRCLHNIIVLRVSLNPTKLNQKKITLHGPHNDLVFF